MEFEWINPRIVEETIEIVLVFNDEGQILFANRTACTKLDYGKEELLEENLTRIFRQEFQNERGGYFSFAKERLFRKTEAAMYRKNSSCFSANVRFFNADTPGSYCLLAEDITGQKDTDTRIRQLREEGEQNHRLKTEFTANVTHELRTPVNGIKGHVLTLLDKVQDEEERKTLEIILYCCDNMSAIINNILDFSKLEAGKFTIEEKEFDFYRMMDRAMATHVATINKKELHLYVYIDDKIPQYIIGDELRLIQILNNLLSNAVKFTTIGFISIDVSKTMQINDEVELFFMIKDSGIGISVEEQDWLFQSYSQADATITRRFGGTGLGLTITKQLVEMMNGTIYVESQKGKGSTFSFYVKLHTSQNLATDQEKQEIYEKWSAFTAETEDDEEGDFFKFGEDANRNQIWKRMEKLVLSIELGAWDKAEALAETIKNLVKNADGDLGKLVLRMEMAIRKENYAKSIEMYERVKEALIERFRT